MKEAYTSIEGSWYWLADDTTLGQTSSRPCNAGDDVCFSGPKAYFWENWPDSCCTEWATHRQCTGAETGGEEKNCRGAPNSQSADVDFYHILQLGRVAQPSSPFSNWQPGDRPKNQGDTARFEKGSGYWKDVPHTWNAWPACQSVCPPATRPSENLSPAAS